MIDHDDLFTTQLTEAGFTPPELPADLPTPAAVEAADRASRYWTSPHVGVLRPGSEAHKREVCSMFHETFNPYPPAIGRLCELGRRPAGAVRRHAECLGRKPPQGGHRQARRGLRDPVGKR